MESQTVVACCQYNQNNLKLLLIKDFIVVHALELCSTSRCWKIEKVCENKLYLPRSYNGKKCIEIVDDKLCESDDDNLCESNDDILCESNEKYIFDDKKIKFREKNVMYYYFKRPREIIINEKFKNFTKIALPKSYENHDCYGIYKIGDSLAFVFNYECGYAETPAKTKIVLIDTMQKEISKKISISDNYGVDFHGHFIDSYVLYLMFLHFSNHLAPSGTHIIIVSIDTDGKTTKKYCYMDVDGVVVISKKLGKIKENSTVAIANNSTIFFNNDDTIVAFDILTQIKKNIVCDLKVKEYDTEQTYYYMHSVVNI